MRDVIVSEAQAAEQNRSIVEAKNALSALRSQIKPDHEVCRHLQEAQLRFLQTKPLIVLATGYTGYLNKSETQELDLSTLVYRIDGSNDACLEASEDHAGSTQTMRAASSSSQLVNVRPEAVTLEDTDECDHQVNSSLGLSLQDDDDATVKETSDEGHSCWHCRTWTVRR